MQKVNISSFFNHLNFTRFLPDFPASDCLLCAASIPLHANKPALICDFCHDRLPLLDRSCRVCGLPLATADTVCGQCLQQSPSFVRTFTAFHYQSPVSELISQLKFNGQLRALPLLTHYLLETLEREVPNGQWPQLLLPVPLHPNKLRRRGFNQARVIAKALSRRLNIPLARVDDARRIKATLPQLDLDANARRRNLKGAFDITTNLPAHLVIIDDVMTTGATANELALTCLKSGVEEVSVWALARADLG